MLNFCGPSYELQTRKADVQRAVNLYLKQVESGSGKADFILEDVPGLVEFADLGSGAIRGCFTTTSGASYWVRGNKAYRLASGGTGTEIGTLASTTGQVEMDANTTQLGMVDGASGYVVTLETDAFTQITSGSFYGSFTMAVIDNYALFIRPDTGQFYISANDDMLEYDALDFASAEGSPDNATAIVADHRQARIFGLKTTEGFFNSGDPDFPFSRDQSSYSQIGTNAPYSARLVANSVCYVGRSDEGGGVVYMSTGNQIQRISTHAVEEALQASTDITQALAYVLQDGGHLFYCLNAPGVATTWVYDLSTKAWHERAEVNADGEFEQWRPTCHTMAFGYHLFGAADGKVYRLARGTYTNGGDEMPRERISPHNAAPGRERVYYGAFEIDASCGDAADGVIPYVQMRYSNDGGNTWTDWMTRELGRTGEYGKKPKWNGTGSAYDRVWHVRCTSNAAFSIIGAACPAAVGNG